jgi:hypothetical protein
VPPAQRVFQFFTVGIGITRDFVVALNESFTDRWWRSQRIDAGAEVKNLPGRDAGDGRAGIDIAAVSSVDLRC